MMTIKIIHYPEEGDKTTEVYETKDIKITQGWLPTLSGGNILDRVDRTYGQLNHTLKENSWVIQIITDKGTELLLPNAELYVMHDGKTVEKLKADIISK